MKDMKFWTLLLAGSFFLGGCGGKVKEGVTLSGTEVGGLEYSEALRRVRENLSYLPLEVRTPAGNFSCEIDYSDDAETLLRRAKRGESLTVTVRRECVSLEEFADMVCRSNAKEPVSAALTFDKTGFTYFPGTVGTACDRARLVRDIGAALSDGETHVSLAVRDVAPAVTEETLRARTRELASFTTEFDAENLPRSRNIALAAERIAGTELAGGAQFSFNETVGSRTAENGFYEANIIADGEFVRGVGGGVCQASTTLFGAALRAGLDIVESNAHSLSVGYVAPSLDAMVSDYSDLKFKNPYPYPIYLMGKAENGRVTFTVYGMPDGLRYEVESEVLFRIDPPEPKVVEGTEDRTVREGKAGIASASYRLVYGADGALLARTLLRRDTYAGVRGILERAPRSDAILEEEGA